VPWRDVSPGYGSWQSVYGLFRRWQRDGTGREIVTALQAVAGEAGHGTGFVGRIDRQAEWLTRRNPAPSCSVSSSCC
jgi:transposase